LLLLLLQQLQKEIKLCPRLANKAKKINRNNKFNLSKKFNIIS